MRQVSFAADDEREPAWNADGRRLAFVSRQPNGSALYVVEPGSTPRLVHRTRGQIRAPAWRPDDSLLAYVLQRDGRSQLRMLSLSDPTVSKPITQGENVFPARAQWLSRESFLYTADGQIKHRMFGEQDAQVIPFEARVEVSPAPTPRRDIDFDDYSRQPLRGITGLTPIYENRLIISALGDLWELDETGRLERQLTTDRFVDSDPAISPDGSRLAFVSDRGGRPQIWLQEPRRSSLRSLTNEPGAALAPVWHPSGAALAYLVADHPATSTLSLKQISIAAREVEVLARGLPADADTAPGPGDRITITTGGPSAPSERRRMLQVRWDSVGGGIEDAVPPAKETTSGWF